MCSLWKLLLRSSFSRCFCELVSCAHALICIGVLSDAVFTFLPWQIHRHYSMRISHYNLPLARTCCFPSPRLSNQRRVRPLLGEAEIKQIKEAEGCTCQNALCWIRPGGGLLANFQKLDCVCVKPCDRRKHLSACGRMRGKSLTIAPRSRPRLPELLS